MFDSVDVGSTGRTTLGLYHRHIATETRGLATILPQGSLSKALFVYTGTDCLQYIEKSSLTGVCFTDTILDGVNINMTDLRWADFSGCDLEGVQ